MRRLCHPAAAIRRALFACSCPIISEKSVENLGLYGVITVRFTHSGMRIVPERYHTTSLSVSTGITSISGMTDASSVLSRGRNIYFIPSSRASIVAGSAHWIGRMIPSSANSQRKRASRMSFSWNSISFQRIQRAIGRS